MPEWFVYSDTPYYPFAVVVPADTPQQAAAIVDSDNDGVVVLPIEAVAHHAYGYPNETIIERLRAEGQGWLGMYQRRVDPPARKEQS